MLKLRSLTDLVICFADNCWHHESCVPCGASCGVAIKVQHNLALGTGAGVQADCFCLADRDRDIVHAWLQVQDSTRGLTLQAPETLSAHKQGVTRLGKGKLLSDCCHRKATRHVLAGVLQNSMQELALRAMQQEPGPHQPARCYLCSLVVRNETFQTAMLMSLPVPALASVRAVCWLWCCSCQPSTRKDEHVVAGIHALHR